MSTYALAADSQCTRLQVTTVQVTHSTAVFGAFCTGVLAPDHDTARCYSRVFPRAACLCWYPLCQAARPPVGGVISHARARQVLFDFFHHQRPYTFCTIDIPLAIPKLMLLPVLCPCKSRHLDISEALYVHLSIELVMSMTIVLSIG